MLKCVSCGATYEPVLADGMLYFHRCPPLSAPELAAAIAAGKIVLPVDPKTSLPETPDVAVTRRTYERAQLRDENIKGPAPRADLPAPIKSAGKGVQDLGPSVSPPVVVVP
jgi:hypothetical protein